MSDFELFYAFNDTLNLIQGGLMNFVSVTFAFIVVGYLAAAKLDRRMVTLVIFLYSTVSAWFLLLLNRSTANFSGLADTIRQRAASGDSSIEWITVVDEPAALAGSAGFFIQAVLLFSYVGAITFFLYQRNAQLSEAKREPRQHARPTDI